MKELYVMVDSSPDEKTKACQEATAAILEYADSQDLSRQLLEALVLGAVSMISAEAYTRDTCSNQARAEIYKDGIGMLSQITGFQVELINMDELSVN
jgi:hypothetical protein